MPLSRFLPVFRTTILSMLPFMDCRFPPLRQWLWAILWSTLFTALFVALSNTDKCFVLIHALSGRMAICAMVWVWLYFFFLLSNRTRLILLTGSALSVFLLLPHIDRFPAMAAESKALGELRSLGETVETYRKENPQQGYPAALPKRPSDQVTELYKIEYQTFHAKSAGPADSFLLQFTPVHCECGTIRSFAVAEDGKVHFAIWQRAAPATKADRTLE